MKMKRVLVSINIIITILLLCSCTNSYIVDTNPALILKKDLKNISSSVISAEIYFIAPAVDIDVETNGEPPETVKESLLEKVKGFSTLENLDEIALKYGWKGHVWTISLNIYPNKSRTKYYLYTADYFKSSDATDTSESNIDAYKNWGGGTVDLTTKEN
jgi:hypothetical protein